MVVKNEEQQTEYDTAINIAITVYNWRRLNTLKMPGDSFNAVIGRNLDDLDAFKEKEKVTLAECLEARK